ncbi:MAG: SRPBCC domain-containing protein [Xanthobacteraceae bacterium]
MLTKPSLTLKRHIKAPPAKVYAAWTQAEQLVRWFGPHETVLDSVKAELDVREGGRFRASFKTMDGEYHEVGGVYREVVPDQRLQFSWAWHSTPERESLVTLTFRPDGEGTMLTLLHEQFFDQAARDGHAHGWAGTLDKLAAIFE